LGLVSIILFAVVIVIGLVAIYKEGKNVRKIHIWLSRIIYILTLFLIVLGIMTFLFF
jgi:putative copper export protein